ncbi:MAG: DsbA family oxidoreductase [Micrococcales bacterium]|nr:DsbA family oxidoreductase [Micrococcales bacterium]
MTDRPIEIDVWSDVTCPWCYLGKRRLERAIADFARPSAVTVRYRAFMRQPDLPAGAGGSVIEAIADRTGMSMEQASAVSERAAIAGRPDGLRISPATQVSANSRDAHRLVALAWQMGGMALQSAVLERLFSAHFAEGKVIDDPSVLARLAGEAGLDDGTVRRALAGDEFGEQVDADIAEAAALEMDEVPFFVANGTYAVVGAQPEEVYAELLARAGSDEDEDSTAASPTAAVSTVQD